MFRLEQWWVSPSLNKWLSEFKAWHFTTGTALTTLPTRAPSWASHQEKARTHFTFYQSITFISHQTKHALWNLKLSERLDNTSCVHSVDVPGRLRHEVVPEPGVVATSEGCSSCLLSSLPLSLLTPTAQTGGSRLFDTWKFVPHFLFLMGIIQYNQWRQLYKTKNKAKKLGAYN